METILKSFDLTDNEIKIYLSILEMGSAMAGKITAKTGIHRRNVYDSIERLVKKGLVGYVLKDNKKYFRANSPKHFLYLLELERKELKQKEKSVKDILPRLLLFQKLALETQRVTVFEGKKGLITVLEDVLKTGKPNMVYSTSKIRIIKEYLKWFHKKRVKARILDQLILNKKEIKRAKELSRLPFTKVRLMTREFDSPLAVNVYSDKVGMLILSGNPIAILIEDKDVAETFRKYFKILWDVAETV